MISRNLEHGGGRGIAFSFDGDSLEEGVLFQEYVEGLPGARYALLGPRRIKDVPFLGEMLAKGKPVCTVLVYGVTRETCYTRLVAQTDALKGENYV